MVDDVPLVQSVDRAVAAMEILARDGWVGVTEISRELDIHKSTVFRLLATLERRGVVEQHAETQKYRLGFAVLRFASSVRSSLDLVRAGRPTCDRLSRQIDETVNLAVLEECDVVYIHQVNLSSSRVSADWLGSHTPAHCSATGKVLLAHLPDRQAEGFLRAPLQRYTSATITDPDRLRAELRDVRHAGYAAATEELEEGLNAVAAPIRGPDGTVVACVSVSGPSYRLEVERMPEVATAVIAAAAEISRRLGFLGDANEGLVG
ncbi:MAG: IclR family transcriptional regulator [Nitriliruptor sp.]|nr:MAG: IclR family transcriptional regulator [Nitriliruptor sp.]